MPIRITVLRHGRTSGASGVYRGDLDTPLSAAGWKQLAASALDWAIPAFTGVATSPLQRCAAFAEDYACQHSLPIKLDAGFKELSFGRWEGLSSAEADAQDAEVHAAFVSTWGETAPPCGESRLALHTRVAAAWTDLVAWEAGGAHRLLLTHAGVMRVLLMQLFDFSPASVRLIALPEAAGFQVSWLAGEMPYLLGLRQPCAD